MQRMLTPVQQNLQRELIPTTWNGKSIASMIRHQYRTLQQLTERKPSGRLVFGHKRWSSCLDSYFRFKQVCLCECYNLKWNRAKSPCQNYLRIRSNTMTLWADRLLMQVRKNLDVTFCPSIKPLPRDDSLPLDHGWWRFAMCISRISDDDASIWVIFYSQCTDYWLHCAVLINCNECEDSDAGAHR